MPEVLNIFIKGHPIAMPRVTPTIVGGHASAYRPERARDSHGIMRDLPWIIWWRIIMANVQREWAIYHPDAITGHRGSGRMRPPLTGPLRIDRTYYFARNKDMLEHPFKYGKDAFPHFIKPDVDNLDKLLFDASSKAGLMKNDCQVCQGEPSKWYCAIGGAPGVRVVVETLVPQSAELFALSGNENRSDSI